MLIRDQTPFFASMSFVCGNPPQKMKAWTSIWREASLAEKSLLGWIFKVNGQPHIGVAASVYTTCSPVQTMLQHAAEEARQLLLN
ncbi:MAG: hypothetical protein PHU85_00335 [Phycisphaerae bacterium]|nr:hypothetical protein [Phycisphaerae bacterium]